MAFQIYDDYAGEFTSHTLDWGSAEQIPFFMEELTYGELRVL
ncbi:hypothetical protein CHCC15075_1395 [Bacillus licheniformis]|nr:hypothetical protein CHCC15075_1395 [Bacillus licheniformis]TWM56780.1 hypothetical protein CHCC14815_0936 [Bacillus licheniformis]TWN03828.1 hypothetical protein CHCC14566_2293 [Bacillus licheniformis]TWN19927.1 hypothetical protein CHCC14562_0727 [Bacillus licheniformis]